MKLLLQNLQDFGPKFHEVLVGHRVVLYEQDFARVLVAADCAPYDDDIACAGPELVAHYVAAAFAFFFDFTICDGYVVVTDSRPIAFAVLECVRQWHANADF